MDKKTKILVFIDWFQPGYKAGGPVRSVANMVSHLKSEVEFFIITRNTDYCETKPYSSVKSDAWNKIDFNTSVFYLSEPSIKKINSFIKEQNFDVVYINGIYSFYFSIVPLFLLRNGSKRIVIAPRGMLSPHALQIKSIKKKVFITLAKLMGLYRNVTFHATNQAESEAVKRLMDRKCRIKTVPNLPKNLPEKRVHRNKENSVVRIFNLARIAPEKNTLFALERLIKYKSGKVIFDIYGAVYDKDYWSRCLQIIRQMPENITVTYRGFLNNNEAKSVLNQYHFLFLPSKGENYGHAIIESLSLGCPVIISNNTPWRELESHGAGWDISLNNPAKFEEILQYCCEMNQNDYDEMSKNAYCFAKKHILDKKILTLNKNLFIDES